ncbi:hypothetical protein AWZ03_007400 [Drosophila navojoa]|uniref:Uncharacterized protein n=2 Tax=Drosophila navojoa TaxID=7232 RepID=A0A484BD13_DRONA|nr:hypothetical protein AWZ03_007400 [Drosophila navojoa]
MPEIVTKPDDEPVNEIDTKVNNKPSGTPSVNVFGSAKPVDTATRELEIEERLAEARRQEKVRHDEGVISEKLSEVQLDKNDSENANAGTISWRRTQEVSDDTKASQGERRRDDPDYNKFNKQRDRNERSENTKAKNNQNHEGRIKEENKNKREPRVQARNTPQQGEPILQSSNKYSGLDDESSE